MGFGYGQTTYWRDDAHDMEGNRVKKTYSADMVAHIWNAQTQSFARTSNGNFAFRGDTLYSYGPGWIVAKLFAEVALINGERVSVTTSGHESDARSACRNRGRFELPAFPSSFADALDQLRDYKESGAKAELKAKARRIYATPEFRLILQAERMEPGESTYGRWDDESGRWERRPAGEAESLGEFLARYAGLRPAAYKREAERMERVAAKAREAEAKREQQNLIRSAIQWADMSGSNFRDSISLRDSYEYGAESKLRELARDLRRYRLKAGLSPRRKRKLWEREKIVRERLANVESLYALAARRSRLASLVRYVRDLRKVGTAGLQLSVWSSSTWRTISKNLAELSGCEILPMASRDKLGRLSYAAAQEQERAESREAAEREAEMEERRRDAAEREERTRANREAWLAGEPLPYPRVGVGPRFERPDGTPYIRIAGDTLATSWGAEVPLAHAVKVFRFVKLCRARGESWHRNGKTIRVGHFQVDSISSNGDFVAGCHKFKWEEVERAARIAGVLESEPSAEAVEAKEGVES